MYLKDQGKLRNLEYQLSHPNKKPDPQPNISQSPAQQQPPPQQQTQTGKFLPNI